MSTVGKRLFWIREQLNLSRGQVAKGVGIQKHLIKLRENEHPTYEYSEFQKYADFYDKIWQERYLRNNDYPEFLKIQVDEITPEWILYGANKSSVVKKVYIAELMEKLRKQTEHFIKTGEVIRGE